MNKTVKIIHKDPIRNRIYWYYAFDDAANIVINKKGADDPDIPIMVNKKTSQARVWWKFHKPSILKIEMQGYYDPETFEYIECQSVITNIKYIMEK